MMYSIVPPELIWRNNESIRAPVTITCGGVMAQAEPLGDGQYRILRILDGRCASFLNPRLQPGQIWRR